MILVTFLILAVVPVWMYIHTFRNASIEADPTRWSEFGSYLGATLGIAISLSTLLLGICATLYLPDFFESRKAHAERVRATLKFSQQLFGRQFTLELAAPAWEIAVKWLLWQGPEGDEYRRCVAASKFLYEHKPFSTSEEANAHPYQNLIRFSNHMLPLNHASATDQSSHNSTCVITELSEYQVLMLWIQFWCGLEVLFTNNLIDRALAQGLFKNTYRWWLEFMLQFRLTGQALKKDRPLQWFAQLETLEVTYSVMKVDTWKQKRKRLRRQLSISSSRFEIFTTATLEPEKFSSFFAAVASTAPTLLKPY